MGDDGTIPHGNFPEYNWKSHYINKKTKEKLLIQYFRQSFSETMTIT